MTLDATERAGTPAPAPAAVTVLIATRDRAQLLRKALASVERACAAAAVATEIVVVDNGSTDDTARVVEQWVAGRPARQHLFVGDRGKARALNRGLGAATGTLIACTDDDVEVRPDWIAELIAFAAQHPEYAAGIGRVRIPPDVTAPEVLARVAYYRTLPLFDLGDAVRDTHHLYGCNMVVRRSAFDAVGRFDERLGPGASGLHEDGDLARRLQRAGLRIGYMPEVVVYHALELERLTPEYFRALHVRDARSRFAMEPRPRRFQSLTRLLGAVVVFAVWTVARNSARQMRARGRVISHAEMVRLCWQAAGASG
jgi:GT2 family glycosyltransferase